MSDFIGPLTKTQAEVGRCPLCNGFSVLEYGKQYKVLIQNWHEPDEALFLPATIRCRECGLSITRAGNKAEFHGDSGAQKEAKRLVLSAWNQRVTPDPSPSGEVVERVREILEPHLRGKEARVEGKWKPILAVVTERLTPIIEAEVRRRMRGEHCPDCPDQGWFIGGQGDEPEQVQCEFCYTNTNSVFYRDNLAPKGAKHE